MVFTVVVKLVAVQEATALTRVVATRNTPSLGFGTVVSSLS